MQQSALRSLAIVCDYMGTTLRGGSRIFDRRGCTSKEWRHYPGFFLGGGASLRNDVTDRWGKQILKADTKKKASSQRGVRTPCTLPLDPPLTLFALVCDLRSAIVCDHMETSLYRTPSKELCPTLNYLYSYHFTKTVLCSTIYASA